MSRGEEGKRRPTAYGHTVNTARGGRRRKKEREAREEQRAKEPHRKDPKTNSKKEIQANTGSYVIKRQLSCTLGLIWSGLFTDSIDPWEQESLHSRTYSLTCPGFSVVDCFMSFIM
eukprot:10120838-Heterocapsa_arctica.AAC.1